MYSVLFSVNISAALCTDDAAEQNTVSVHNIDAEEDVHKVTLRQGTSVVGAGFCFQVVINLTDAPVTVSSDSYPAAPDFAQPDSGNHHQGLLQQHLRIQKIICSFS